MLIVEDDIEEGTVQVHPAVVVSTITSMTQS